MFLPLPKTQRQLRLLYLTEKYSTKDRKKWMAQVTYLLLHDFWSFLLEAHSLSESICYFLIYVTDIEI